MVFSNGEGFSFANLFDDDFKADISGLFEEVIFLNTKIIVRHKRIVANIVYIVNIY